MAGSSPFFITGRDCQTRFFGGGAVSFSFHQKMECPLFFYFSLSLACPSLGRSRNAKANESSWRFGLATQRVAKPKVLVECSDRFFRSDRFGAFPDFGTAPKGSRNSTGGGTVLFRRKIRRPFIPAHRASSSHGNGWRRSSKMFSFPR